MTLSSQNVSRTALINRRKIGNTNRGVSRKIRIVKCPERVNKDTVFEESFAFGAKAKNSRT